MATTYRQKGKRKNNAIYAIGVALLISAIFLGMISSLHSRAKNEAYEMLHIQTKQIKDDLTLQINSDKENLLTMANFAAKLYARGEDYSIMFDSFKPIGLYSRIGILTQDSLFITKDETVDLSKRFPFSEASASGEHVTGRTVSYSKSGEAVVRTGVPITVNGETVGMIYGITTIESINEKYNKMAKELDAQLFVYNKEDKKYIIDTIHDFPTQLSDLENRKYHDGYSYEAFLTTDKGYSSFESTLTNEDLYVHYSTIEDFNWGIILARYESQVFAEVRAVSHLLLLTFLIIIFIILCYISIVLRGERRRTQVTAKASSIRKMLLEINQQTNLSNALNSIREFSGSRSAFFANSDGEDYNNLSANLKGIMLSGDHRNSFLAELFKYAGALHNENFQTVEIMRILANKHLAKTNPDFYNTLKEHGIKEASFAIITEKNNHVSILGVVNPKRSDMACSLLKDIAICFSIAIFNKNHLNKTELTATTDSLTGAFNRVAYKKDINAIDEEKPRDFSCIYIDVNELHIRNNTYGHAAGDEMLVYIVNTLKDVFFGHNVYRIGGDEFVVFVKNTEPELIRRDIQSFVEQLTPTGYKVSVGVSYRKQNPDCEEMVREAEMRMYEAKTEYYQNKKNSATANNNANTYVQTKTGISEIDTMLSVLQEHYNGIYRVTLDSDRAHRILMPAYLGYKENEENFSKLVSKYIHEMVHPDFSRAVLSLLNYDAVKRQLAEGKTPSISYRKTDGEAVTLSIYNLAADTDIINDTLWVFAKK